VSLLHTGVCRAEGVLSSALPGIPSPDVSRVPSVVLDTNAPAAPDVSTSDALSGRWWRWTRMCSPPLVLAALMLPRAPCVVLDADVKKRQNLGQ
jgi:hypothetical protein